MGICHIVGGVENSHSISKTPGDFIIAVDAGYKYLKGVKPDLVMGDFDSLVLSPKGRM